MQSWPTVCSIYEYLKAGRAAFRRKSCESGKQTADVKWIFGFLIFERNWLCSLYLLCACDGVTVGESEPKGVGVLCNVRSWIYPSGAWQEVVTIWSQQLNRHPFILSSFTFDLQYSYTGVLHAQWQLPDTSLLPYLAFWLNESSFQ